MTSNTRRYLRIFDREQERNLTVYGLGRGYLNLTADAAQLAVGPRAKGQLLLMIAPEAVHPEDTQAEFYALAWSQAGISSATALAATLERYSHFPMRIAWGEYLLAAAIQDYGAEALLTGGTAPAGYVFPANIPWGTIISQGLQQGRIKLND